MVRRSSRPMAGGGRKKRRKWDDYSFTWTPTAFATNTFAALDVMQQFKTDFGSKPHQATLSIPRFDITTDALGTGTGTNTITLGFMIGSSNMALTDPALNPANSHGMWWVRKYQLQNNSNPPGVLWAIQGTDALNWKVRTRRTLKELDDTLWMCLRADYAGFTASSLNISVSLHVGILYP